MDELDELANAAATPRRRFSVVPQRSAPDVQGWKALVLLGALVMIVAGSTWIVGLTSNGEVFRWLAARTGFDAVNWFIALPVVFGAGLFVFVAGRVGLFWYQK